MVTQFGPVRFLPAPNSGKYPFCHSLYVEADLKVVIDPGSDRDKLAQLKNSPGVDAVWLSHYHEDHFLHLGLFEDQELWVSKTDAPALADLEVFLDYYGMFDKDIRPIWSKVIENDFHYRPRTPDRLFQGEELIDLGGVMVQAIPTPGHTAGHFSFFFPDEGVLYLGDYDLTPFGPWYGDDTSDIEATISSVNRLRQIPATIWLVGHERGVFQSDPGELWDRYLAVIEDRESKLVELLTGPRTVAELAAFRLVYRKKREPQALFDYYERLVVAKHLARMIRRGQVIEENGFYRRV